MIIAAWQPLWQQPSMSESHLRTLERAMKNRHRQTQSNDMQISRNGLLIGVHRGQNIFQYGHHSRWRWQTWKWWWQEYEYRLCRGPLQQGPAISTGRQEIQQGQILAASISGHDEVLKSTLLRRHQQRPHGWLALLLAGALLLLVDQKTNTGTPLVLVELDTYVELPVIIIKPAKKMLKVVGAFVNIMPHRHRSIHDSQRRQMTTVCVAFLGAARASWLDRTGT
jgi:hypothetical protein